MSLTRLILNLALAGSLTMAYQLGCFGYPNSFGVLPTFVPGHAL